MSHSPSSPSASEPSTEVTSTFKNTLLGFWSTLLVLVSFLFFGLQWLVFLVPAFRELSKATKVGIVLILVLGIAALFLGWVKSLMLKGLSDRFIWQSIILRAEAESSSFQIQFQIIEQLSQDFMNLGFQLVQEYRGDQEEQKAQDQDSSPLQDSGNGFGQGSGDRSTDASTNPSTNSSTNPSTNASTTGSPEGSTNSSSYVARLFVHSDHHCFAEVGQLLSQAPTPDVIYSIHSMLDGEWEFSTTHQYPNGMSWMFRNPKSVIIFAPSATPQDLLELHLERREQVMADLGVDLLRDLSWDWFVLLEDRSTIGRKRRLRQKPIFWGLIEATWFEFNPQYEWLGNYPQVAAKCKGRKDSNG